MPIYMWKPETDEEVKGSIRSMLNLPDTFPITLPIDTTTLCQKLKELIPNDSDRKDTTADGSKQAEQSM